MSARTVEPDVHLSELALSERTLRALTRHRLITVGDVLPELPDGELLFRRGIGAVGYAEIVAVLADEGVDLPDGVEVS